MRKPAKFTRLDAILLLLTALGALALGYRIKVGLHYQWNWSAIPQYLFHLDPATGRWAPNLLMQGLFTTIRLSAWATVLATVIGTLAAFFRISSSLFKRMLGRTFVELIRNTPPLVLIFIFYFFVSDQIMPILAIDQLVKTASPGTRQVLTWLLAPPEQLPAFLSATVTVAMFEAAYITEIVRAGIQLIDRGQFEAAAALGFSRTQQMWDVILPQALQRILPPLAGQFISTIKDSAIVSVISIQELTFQGMELMAATHLIFECWITITALYLILTLTLSLAVSRLEQLLRRGLT